MHHAPGVRNGMGPRLRERRKAATRAQLLRAGRKLFSERGLYEARIEDLAGLAGVAKGTLYLYFRDKNELISLVVAEGYEQLGSHVARRAVGVRSSSALLERLAEAHLEFFQAHPDLARIFHQGRGMLLFRRPEWRPLAQPLRRHLALLAELLEASPALRRRSEGRRDRTAELLFGLVSGATSVVSVTGGAGRAGDWARDVARSARRLALAPGSRGTGGRA
jgi:AcrR family transcriptional regulator